MTMNFDKDKNPVQSLIPVEPDFQIERINKKMEKMRKKVEQDKENLKMNEKLMASVSEQMKKLPRGHREIPRLIKITDKRMKKFAQLTESFEKHTLKLYDLEHSETKRTRTSTCSFDACGLKLQ